MSMLSRVKLPSGDYYDLMAKGLYGDFECEPMLTVEFTTAANGSYYEIFTVMADKAYVGPVDNPFFMKIESETTVSSVVYKSVSYVMCNNLTNLNMTNCYAAWNNIQNASYSHYYLRAYYPATASNYTSMPIKFSVRNYGSYATKYKIKVFRIPDGFSNLTEGTKAVIVTTNYSTGTDINLRSSGLQETGDTDTIDRLRYPQRPYAAKAIYGYKLYMLDKDNRAQPLVVTNSTSISTAKTTNTASMKGSSGIFYHYNSGTTNAGSALGSNASYSSFPTGSTGVAYNLNSNIPAYNLLYIKGSYNKTTDSFVMEEKSDTSWYVSVPMNTANITLSSYFTEGSHYILLGHTSAAQNDLYLNQDNPIYYFDGTNLTPVNNIGTKYDFSVSDELLTISIV